MLQKWDTLFGYPTFVHIAAATTKAVKAIIAAAQRLFASIVAGGWVAVLVIVIILVIALVVCSCFGVFFSNQETGNEELMKDVVQEINTEYQHQLNELQADIAHDKVEISGSRAVWPEVLSVYAVMVTSDPDNPIEVATMDETKKAILKDIFWQMNEITYEEETRDEMELTEVDDGEGNIVEEWTEVTKAYLLINTISLCTQLTTQHAQIRLRCLPLVSKQHHYHPYRACLQDY